MAGIERMRGDSEAAEQYEDLMPLARAEYDRLFWSGDTGRYINTIDTDGVKRDYGLTFQNFEALKYGLGDAAKAQSIFDWVDGARIVESDFSKGADIMRYKVAARSNTVKYESVIEQPGDKTWWHGPDAINVFGNAAFGKHLENGGYIFYTVYYELMSRLKYLGADSVVKRYQDIADEYEFNGRLKTINGWEYGLTTEFPESGLVPTAYFYGLLGINAGHSGLTVAPAFSSAYNTMGVAKTVYGGNSYKIEMQKSGALTVTGGASGFDMKLQYKPSGGADTFAVRLRNTSTLQNIVQATAARDSDGYLKLDFTGANSCAGAAQLTIAAVTA
jgi:hypothetical protein